MSKRIYNSDVRIERLVNMYKEQPIEPTRLIISTFHISIYKQTILFAFVYSEIVGRVGKPKYFCANPSFESKDGEYRPKIGKYDNISTIEKTYPALLNEIDEYLNSKKQIMKWELKVNHFYPSEGKKSKDYEYAVERSSNRLLSIIWFNCISNIYYGMIEVHTNIRFAKVLGLTGLQLAKDTKFFEYLESNYGSSLRHLRQLQDYFYPNPNLDRAFRLGQKIIPLSIMENENRYSLDFKPWRELLVSSRLADMVISGVCPAFPIIMMHFCISNGTDLFDNEVQRNKIKLSNAAKEVVRLLDKAKNVLNIEDVLSDKISTLENMLDEPSNYSKREIILSDSSLCIISEFMGKTLHNALESAMRSNIYNTYVGDILTNSDTFAKFIFEYLYAFLCAGEKGGVINGDIHTNNVCINPIYSTVQQAPIPDGCVIYKISGKSYIMKTTQYYAGVIDYSRCIIRPSMIGRYRSPNNHHSSIKEMMNYSNCRIKHLYTSYFPDYNIVRLSIEDEFSKLILFDPFLLASKLKEYMVRAENSSRFGNTLDTNISLLDNIIKSCKLSLTGESKSTLFDIINENFSRFIDAEHDPSKIVDTYDFGSQIRYSFESPEMMPPMFRRSAIRNI